MPVGCGTPSASTSETLHWTERQRVEQRKKGWRDHLVGLHELEQDEVCHEVDSISPRDVRASCSRNK